MAAITALAALAALEVPGSHGALLSKSLDTSCILETRFIGWVLSLCLEKKNI
tara:strand:- start:814 stop:969 length:156 start_codon:yes stop_codon:yes gene_type:complete